MYRVAPYSSNVSSRSSPGKSAVPDAQLVVCSVRGHVASMPPAGSGNSALPGYASSWQPWRHCILTLKLFVLQSSCDARLAVNDVVTYHSLASPSSAPSTPTICPKSMSVVPVVHIRTGGSEPGWYPSHSIGLGTVALTTVITSVRGVTHAPEYSEPSPLYGASMSSAAGSKSFISHRSHFGLHGVQKVSSRSISHLSRTGGISVSTVNVSVIWSPLPKVES